tara:strand:+ start:517 stop:849 length:333 start_codon:yes stop_codon:yes gene_type:complete
MSSTTTLIQNWFTRTWGGGLVLPDGWFGRPFDNIHRLTDVSQSSGLLRIVLDDQLTLTFNGDVSVKDNGDELVIDGYSELSFDWKEYGSDLPHSYIYQDGQTKLVAPPGQ